MKSGPARSLLLALAAAGLFAGAYLLMGVILPDPTAIEGPNAGTDGPLSTPQPTLPGEGLGPSEDVSFRLFDPESNQPVAQVTVASYRRTDERTVALRDVTIASAARGGGLIVVTSPSGTIRVAPPAAGSSRQVDVGALAAADEARLRDVRVDWYASQADADAGRSPELSAEVDNVLFDYDRFALSTADTTLAGRTVLADDVPVRIRGRNYDFDGRGLRVEWDAQAGRPTLVRIARADRLVIKRPPAFLPGEAEARRPRPVGDIRLASLDDELSVAPQAEAEVEVEVFPYAATITGEIVAEQAGRPLLSADEARTLFALTAGDTNPLRAGPAEPVAPRVSPPATPPQRPVTPPAPEPDSDEPAPPAPPAPPAFEPVVVTWQGPLVIEPADDRASELLSPKDARLTLVGQPVVADLDGATARARRVTYHGDADTLVLHGEDQDVVLVDPEGNRLAAPRVRSTPGAGEAVAAGAGYAELVGDEPIDLRWGESCTFRFEVGQDGERRLRHVDATGGIQVRSSDFELTSRSLGLDLAEEAGEAGEATRLERAVAVGGVRCLVEADDGLAAFSADRLIVTLPEGQAGPVEVEAIDAVGLRRTDGHLTGDTLRATLKPREDGRLDLTTLVVEGNVVAVNARGQRLEGDRAVSDGADSPIIVTGEDGRATVTAETDAGERAIVAAATLVLDPQAESLAAPEPGDLLVLRPTPGGPQASRMTWQGTLVATEDRVDADGDVVIAGLFEGFEIDAAAESVVVLLAEESDGDGGEPEPAVEQVESVTMEGEVSLTAESRSQDDALLRSLDLRAPALTARPAAGLLLITQPGQALYRDLRPEGEDEEPDPAFRGAAAFGWQDGLTYDRDAGRLRLNGDATAQLEPADAPAVRLTADTFDIAISLPDDGPVEFSSATATGEAVLTARNLSIEAREIAYDPVVQTLTARARPGGSVRVFDAQGRSRGAFSSVTYNVTTGRLDRLQDLRVGG
jgi:hypothetical protein